MEEKVLYSMESPFQQEINVKGYYFGKNEGKEHCRRNFEKTYQLQLTKTNVYVILISVTVTNIAN